MIRVFIETAEKKTFASALDWPGWSRSGKTEAEAIDILLAYTDRYQAISDLAAVPFGTSGVVEIADRQSGDGATQFGVPNHIHEVEHEPVDDDEIGRQLSLLKASWDYFESVRAIVSPELQKGPRGGGRDRDRIFDHVVQADRGYARHIGVLTTPFDSFDPGAVAGHHESVFTAIPSLKDGPLVSKSGWPVRYAIRRMMWHILDHAWEMEDKDLTPKESK